jgi:hypothetical protein
MIDQAVGDTDFLCGHFSGKAPVGKEDVLFDLLQIQFIHQVGKFFN